MTWTAFAILAMFYNWISIFVFVSAFVFLSDLYGEALRATDDLLRGKERTLGEARGAQKAFQNIFV